MKKKEFDHYKYRIDFVKTYCGKELYVIKRRYKFLWWTWFETAGYYQGDTWTDYEFDTYDEAEEFLLNELLKDKLRQSITVGVYSKKFNEYTKLEDDGK